MYCLKINFQSLQINNNLIHGKEKIKISVLTFPGEDKQSIIVDPKNVNKMNYFINFRTNKDFKMLIFIFERKNFFQFNPMIASRAIEASCFPNSIIDSTNTEPKTFDIFTPNCYKYNGNETKIAGKMTIQCFLSLYSSFKENKSPYNISKLHNGEGYSPINENKNGNRLRLLDEEYIY